MKQHIEARRHAPISPEINGGPAKKNGKAEREPPFSLRLTKTEKALLRQKAGTMPIGTYVKKIVLGDDAKPNKRRPIPVVDARALGQILGLLSQSRIANNLNQLAKAVNLGALPVQKETESDIRQACADVALMRTALLRALGQIPEWEGERLVDLYARIVAGRVR